MTKAKGLNILLLGNTETVSRQVALIPLPEDRLGSCPSINSFHADSLEQAIQYLSLKHFDLILLGLDLSAKNSHSYLSTLQNNAPRSAVILLSDNTPTDRTEKDLFHSAFDSLTFSEATTNTLARIFRHFLSINAQAVSSKTANNKDLITGLSNRTGFMEYLERQLAEAERLQFHLSLFFVDCDNFKMINDTLGHQKGDDFLAHFAQHLSQCVRSNDFLARVSADEFAVVINSKDNRVIPSAVVADKIQQSIRRGIQLTTGEPVEAHCSIGITHYSGDGQAPSPDKFLQEANSALKQSKKKGGDCTSFFDKALGRKAERRVQLLTALRTAFKRGEFYLHYQPIIEASTDRVRGFEALLRWNKSGKEMVSPAEFVPLLEETGMIHIIGSWVIQQASSDYIRLLEAGCIDERAWMSVNISPLQLQDFNFARRLKSTLQDINIKPDRLHLEITESSLMEKSEFTFQTLDAIKQMGCHLSLDDFGVGYSSMTHLRELPIDTLKVDQSFIRPFDNAESDQAILRAMVSLGHHLHKKVVAEGVETAAAANFLKQRRCDYLQGFYYSKPLPIEEVAAYASYVNRTAGLHSEDSALG